MSPQEIIDAIDAVLDDNVCPRCSEDALHHVDHHAYSYTYCASCQFHLLDHPMVSTKR